MQEATQKMTTNHEADRSTMDKSNQFEVTPENKRRIEGMKYLKSLISSKVYFFYFYILLFVIISFIHVQKYHTHPYPYQYTWIQPQVFCLDVSTPPSKLLPCVLLCYPMDDPMK